MRKRHKKNQIKRYLSVLRRNLQRLTWKKVRSWLKKNFNQHPFILAALFFFWIDSVLLSKNYGKDNIPRLIRLHLFIIAAWFALVVISNLLKDKQKVKWYLRKRFVFLTLILFYPLGLILLWSGARFKKITKIILTLTFVSGVIFLHAYYNKKYEKLMAKNPVERIVATISKSKKKIYIKLVDKNTLSGLQLATIPRKAKTKLAVSDVASRCSSATVSIRTKDKDGQDIGIGSGFIISSDGIIVTNFHVLESAYQAEVKIGENQFKEASLIKGDPAMDIALLKIDTSDLSVLPIGNSDDLINGQFIVVLGSPWGFEHSVSSGIIGGLRSKDNIKLIQMTAPVSPGSSGGPVINEFGEVIGITTVASFLLAQNLNFAIPINNLRKLIGEQ